MANIKRLGQDAKSGAIIGPMLSLYLERGSWPEDFTVKLPGGSGHRAPDGYFHPSSHPTLSAQDLYIYLTDPQKYYEGGTKFGGEARMSMTVGTILHSLNRTALIDLGLWQRPAGRCPCCQREYGDESWQCDEPGVIDEEVGQRGHMDGILELKQRDKPVGYDLKTINAFRFNKAKPGLDFFRAEWPKYYGQGQSYLSMRPDLDEVIFLFQQIGYPWGMMEYNVPRDDAYISAMLAKYRLVRAHVAQGHMPGEMQI